MKRHIGGESAADQQNTNQKHKWQEVRLTMLDPVSISGDHSMQKGKPQTPIQSVWPVPCSRPVFARFGSLTYFFLLF